MKQAILLHGTGGSGTDYYWFEDTKVFLRDNGYDVWWPELPNTDKPKLVETRAFIEREIPLIDENTIIIAHSSACPLILSILQRLKIQIHQLILTSGYYESIGGESSSMLPEDGFEWESIKQSAKEIIFINSDDDPWGCNDAQARQPAVELEAKLVINVGQGHMGSDSFKQPYREFKLLKRLLDVGKV